MIKLKLLSTDTERLAFQVTQNILNKLSNPPKVHTWENKESLLGLQSDDVAKKVVQIYDLPITWQTYKQMARHEAVTLMENCTICEGFFKNSFFIVNSVLIFRLF